jgi:ankyrin repeat protein
MSVCWIQRGRTPLHMAAAHGVARAIPILLEAGAEVDAKDAVREPAPTDNHSQSPIVIQYRSLEEGVICV